jgi:hypothetical protein
MKMIQYNDLDEHTPDESIDLVGHMPDAALDVTQYLSRFLNANC